MGVRATVLAVEPENPFFTLLRTPTEPTPPSPPYVRVGEEADVHYSDASGLAPFPGSGYDLTGVGGLFYGFYPGSHTTIYFDVPEEVSGFGWMNLAVLDTEGFGHYYRIKAYLDDVLLFNHYRYTGLWPGSVSASEGDLVHFFTLPPGPHTMILDVESDEPQDYPVYTYSDHTFTLDPRPVWLAGMTFVALDQLITHGLRLTVAPDSIAQQTVHV